MMIDHICETACETPPVRRHRRGVTATMFSRLCCVMAAGVALLACVSPVSKAVSGPLDVERGAECRTACSTLGMQLTSVVLIMNSAGCVCQAIEPAPPPAVEPTRTPAPQPVSAGQSGAAAAAGGAAIAAVVAAQQQRQHSSRSPSSPPPPSFHH